MMSKSVMISIKPKWCELIANGKKTVEVRKTKPKLQTPFKVYIYCTKDEPLYRSGDKFCCNNGEFGNGKVIGEFVCESIKEFKPVAKNSCIYYISENEILRTGLTQDEILDYADGKFMYHWHISNLVIYDKPRELREFYTKCDEGCEDCDFWKSVRVNADEYDMECSSGIYGHRTLKRPPQSWCYVESEVEGE